MEKDLLECLSNEVHEVWSETMKHIFNSQTALSIARWERQMQTPYDELSESEKQLDREIAKRYLEIMERKKC